MNSGTTLDRGGNIGLEVQRFMRAASDAGYKPVYVNGYDANPLEQLPDVVGMALLDGLEPHVLENTRFPRPVAAVLRRVPPAASNEAILWTATVYGEENGRRFKEAFVHNNIGILNLVLDVVTHNDITLFEHIVDDDE